MHSGEQTQAIAEVEEFIRIAAHDLRNPIAVVRVSAQMAQRQLGRGDLDLVRGRLQAIVEQSDRVADMLESFVDAASISAGFAQLQRGRVDLRDIVFEAVDRERRSQLEQGARAVELDVPEGVVGAWDGKRLQRAVRALVSNAFIYGDPTCPVIVRCGRESSNVLLAIDGGGHGPTSEEAARLFERFYRGPSAAEAGQSGSGLGLFTARGIARLHGGDVRHVSGDTFELLLPID